MTWNFVTQGPPNATRAASHISSGLVTLARLAGDGPPEGDHEAVYRDEAADSAGADLIEGIVEALAYLKGQS